GDYTPKPKEEIDDSLYVYGKKGPQKPEISVSDNNSSEHSTCQSNDSEGSCGNTSEHSFETESDSLSAPNEMSKSSRFTKTNDFKGVPHPLSGDYTPKPQEDIDDSLYVYGKKGPQKPEISVSDESSSKHSTCQSNDSEGSYENTSEHSFETESESVSEPSEMSKSSH
ncbi:hypothetical protein Tco_1338994, partial [Tanacetum coccineum]